jgi:histidinol-phosphatase
VSAAADDLALALQLADIADEITLSRFRAEDLLIQTKPDMTPVTEADLAVERALRARLAEARPDDAIVGEEFGDSGSAPGVRRWIIDPIDGTKSYARGIPSWGTLLALQNGDEVALGVVSAPQLHRRWWALRGAGAFVNGVCDAARRIHVSALSSLAEAQLCLSAVTEWEAIGRLDAILKLERACWRTRGPGDMLSYMLVAEGVAEIGLDPVAELWDMAAMQVIVEEAGGRFTDLAGVRTPAGGDGIATNGLVHEAALAIIGR